ncbi:MAG: DUF4012 domain-containing protein [Acidimicrobiales bacterium]
MAVAVAGRLDVLQTRRARTATFTLAVAASAALAAVVSDAAPTGVELLDLLYVGGFAATVAFFAGSARRWTWFLPAAAGAALAAGGVSLALAAASIAIGFWSVLADTRSRARGAVVAGLGMASLLDTDSVLFHGATALLAAVAVIPVVWSGYHLAARRVRRRVRRVAALLFIPVGFIGVGLAVGAMSTYDDLLEGFDQIEEGVVAAQDADADEAAVRLTEASRHLLSASDTLGSWFVRPARALPVVGQHLHAVEQLAEDSGDVARISGLAATAADVDAIRFTDGRIDPQVLRNMIQPLRDTSTALEQARTAADDVRSPWLVSYLESYIDKLDEQVDENLPDAQNAALAVEFSYGLLGGNGTPRRYLVLFTTPSETRGRTGFAGNFAELLVENGAVSMPRFGRLSELVEQGIPIEQRTLVDPDLGDYLRRYGRFEPTSWRNFNMSPDLPTVAQAAAELYPQSGGAPIDGVMTVDPVGLAALMNFTGGIRPDELEDPGGLDRTLDSTNVANFLLYEQYVDFADRSQRVDFLEDVAELTFDRLTSNAEVPSPREAIDILDPVVDAGHIQFTTFDESESFYFAGLGLSGLFSSGSNDLVSLVTSNAAGNKIDYFLQRGLRYDATWDPSTGAVAGRITATLTNGAPASGLPDYVIGSDLDEIPIGTNRSFVSIYTPYDLDAARVNGAPVAVESGRELDRQVYSLFVDIPAGATFTIELDVSGSWTEDTYALEVPRQPLANPDQIAVNLTVAGELPVAARGEGATIEGRIVRWTGPLTNTVHIEANLDR